MSRDEEAFPRVFLRIKELYKKGFVSYSYHSKLRKEQRRIDTPDIENLIRYGRMVEKRTEPGFKTPTYTIEGFSVDGEKIGCSVAVVDNILIIVTAFRRDRRR